MTGITLLLEVIILTTAHVVACPWGIVEASRLGEKNRRGKVHIWSQVSSASHLRGKSDKTLGTALEYRSADTRSREYLIAADAVKAAQRSKTLSWGSADERIWQGSHEYVRTTFAPGPVVNFRRPKRGGHTHRWTLQVRCLFSVP